MKHLVLLMASALCAQGCGEALAQEEVEVVAPEAYFNAGSIVIATGPDFHEMDDAMRRAPCGTPCRRTR